MNKTPWLAIELSWGNGIIDSPGGVALLAAQRLVSQHVLCAKLLMVLLSLYELPALRLASGFAWWLNRLGLGV